MVRAGGERGRGGDEQQVVERDKGTLPWLVGGLRQIKQGKEGTATGILVPGGRSVRVGCLIGRSAQAAKG
jgi:hypothetical protein